MTWIINVVKTFKHPECTLLSLSTSFRTRRRSFLSVLQQVKAVSIFSYYSLKGLFVVGTSREKRSLKHVPGGRCYFMAERSRAVLMVQYCLLLFRFCAMMPCFWNKVNTFVIVKSFSACSNKDMVIIYYIVGSTNSLLPYPNTVILSYPNFYRNVLGKNSRQARLFYN